MAKPIWPTESPSSVVASSGISANMPPVRSDGVHQRNQADQQKAAMRQQPSICRTKGIWACASEAAARGSRRTRLADQKPGDHGRRPGLPRPSRETARRGRRRRRAVRPGMARRRNQTETQSGRWRCCGRADRGGLMSASTIWPVVRMMPAPAPATMRASIEFREARRLRAPETSRRRNEAADGQHGPPAQPVRKLPSGQDHRKTREAVNGDGNTDGCRRDTERVRVKRQRRHHRAEAKLVHGDENAHPEQRILRSDVKSVCPIGVALTRCWYRLAAELREPIGACNGKTSQATPLRASQR